MKQKEKNTAKKLYNMLIDSATTDNEKEIASAKLTAMLKKHKASLVDFVDNVDSETAKLFDFKEVESIEVKRNYLLKDRSIKTSNNKISRRKLVINMLKENKFSKREIAVILTDTHKIADLANNLKCVSGTIYDLASNNKAKFKIDNNTDKITATFI